MGAGRSTMRSLLLAIALGGGGLLSCQSDQACRSARLSGVSAWKDVRAQAGKLKLEGGPGYDQLSAAQKKEHFATFDEIEAGATLIFEGFAFEKIGWMGARNGRDRVTKALKSVNRQRFAGFSASADNALKHFTEVEASCR